MNAPLIQGGQGRTARDLRESSNACAFYIVAAIVGLICCLIFK